MENQMLEKDRENYSTDKGENNKQESKLIIFSIISEILKAGIGIVLPTEQGGWIITC